MPDRMSDRMPEDLPVGKCINVMVGFTRSKVILYFYRYLYLDSCSCRKSLCPLPLPLHFAAPSRSPLNQGHFYQLMHKTELLQLGLLHAPQTCGLRSMNSRPSHRQPHGVALLDMLLNWTSQTAYVFAVVLAKLSQVSFEECRQRCWCQLFSGIDLLNIPTLESVPKASCPSKKRGKS